MGDLGGVQECVKPIKANNCVCVLCNACVVSIMEISVCFQWSRAVYRSHQKCKKFWNVCVGPPICPICPTKCHIVTRVCRLLTFIAIKISWFCLFDVLSLSVDVFWLKKKREKIHHLTEERQWAKTALRVIGWVWKVSQIDSTHFLIVSSRAPFLPCIGNHSNRLRLSLESDKRREEIMKVGVWVCECVCWGRKVICGLPFTKSILLPAHFTAFPWIPSTACQEVEREEEEGNNQGYVWKEREKKT